MALNIIYEDNDFLAVNKPSGLTVHKTGPRDRQITLVDLILKKYPEIKNVGEPSTSLGQGNSLRPGIVHRLDKETSGLMIVAKNQTAFLYFKNLFQKRLIKKIYLALVYGHLKNKSGRIDLPLGKIGTRQTTRLKGKKELKERQAVTEYRVIKYYTLNLKRCTLLSASPLTGRTHQIRVHLKSIGHPIVGDRIYGSKVDEKFPRLFLHAQKLEFTSPSGQRMILEADLPMDLTDFLNSDIIL